MGRRERPIDPSGGPLHAFALQLRELRTAAGAPSYRDLARRAHFSDTSLSVAASGAVMPSLEVTLGYVRACGGDVAEWERRWHRLAVELGVGAPAAPAVPAVHAGPAAAAASARRAGVSEVPRPGGGSGSGSATAPAQLPHSVAEFTGRDSKLAALDALLGGAQAGPAVRIAVITGAPGVGKTALAVHWAQQVSRRFGDGQLYVNLRGYASVPPMRPIDALGQLLRGLGVDPQQHPVDLDEAAALYRTVLGSRRMLVVLDNAAFADQVRPLLPGNPACLVLVTSRDRLNGLVAYEGARVVEVDVLRPEESVTLLGRLVGRDRVGAEPAAAASLADLCAHLPLAIRIAAANLANDPRRPVGEFTADLERTGENRLSALEVRDDTRAAVRATFDLSYAALPPQARRAFRRLGLAPGPDLTADVTAVLTGTSLQQAAELLERLATAHLVGEYVPGRFRFHDLLRLYARQRARADDGGQARHAAVGRLLSWYLAMADRAAALLYPHLLRCPADSASSAPSTPADLAGRAAQVGRADGADRADRRNRRPAPDFADHKTALAWLDAERPNLTAAIAYGAGHGHLRLAWLLADTLRGYFALRRHMVDWLTMASVARDAAGAAGDVLAAGAAWLSLAHAYWSVGDYPAAAEHYSTALDLAQQAAWTEGQATILGNLGLVYWEIGRLDDATGHLTEALRLDRACGRQLGVANHLANLGYMYRSLGRLHEAAQCCAEALVCYRDLGSAGGEANALANLGIVYQDLGQLDEAMTVLQDALARYQRIGDRSNEAGARLSLSLVHADLGDHARACELATSALSLAREIGDRRAQADALNALGRAAAGLGDHEQAASQYTAALDLARETGARYQEAEALIGLYAIHAKDGAADSAAACAAGALTIAEATGDRRLRGRVQALASDNPDGVSSADVAPGSPDALGEPARA